MELTEEQKELVYAALMAYGNKLSNIAKDIPNEMEIADGITDRAKEAWNLAKKIVIHEGW